MIVRIALNFISIFGFLLAATDVAADHPTVIFGSESAGAINTLPAETMPQGKWGYGIRTEIIENKPFSRDQLEGFAVQGLEGVHSMDRIINTSISIAYGASENLTVIARLPYIVRKNIREAELVASVPEAHVHGDSSGLGDLSVVGQYRFFRNNNTDASLLLGFKAPTGETDVSDIEGVRFETEFQPGTGAWDILVGMALSRKFGKAGFHANILYNNAAKGSQATKLGDAVSCNVALSYRLNGEDRRNHDHTHSHANERNSLHWDMILELNGESRRMNKISGESEVNSGGTIIYLSPGVKVSSSAGLGGFLSVGIPIVKDDNGTQTQVDARIVAGFSFAL